MVAANTLERSEMVITQFDRGLRVANSTSGIPQWMTIRMEKATTFTVRGQKSVALSLEALNRLGSRGFEKQRGQIELGRLDWKNHTQASAWWTQRQCGQDFCNHKQKELK